MLASILPGFREVRTPLVTGYLYLLCVWIWFGGDRLAPDEPTNTFTRRIRDLFDRMGRPAAGVAISFAAYLIGALLTVRTPPRHTAERIVDRWRRPLGERLERDESGRILNQQPTRSQKLANWLHLELEKLGKPIPWGVSAWLDDQVDSMSDGGVRKIVDELKLDDSVSPRTAVADELDWQITRESKFEVLLTRLRTKQPDMWNDYDRLASEASLRLSILTPLVLLVGEAVKLWTGWAAIVVVVPAALFVQGLSTYNASRRQVWNALITDAIDSPTMTRFIEIASEDKRTKTGEHTRAAAAEKSAPQPPP